MTTKPTEPAPDVVAWLREVMDTAQRDAEAAGGDAWRRQDHPSDTVAVYDSKGEPVVYDEGSPSEEQQTHIVRNSPAAVLRRIAADRKLLDDLLAERHADSEEDVWYACAALTDDDGDPVCPNESRAPGPCDCGRDARVARWMRLLAEAWGWGEETT